jgi:MarR family transcriptional regulator, organic hydroperoxide resistance regulator
MSQGDKETPGELAEAFLAVYALLQHETIPMWFDLDFSMAQLKTLLALRFRGPATVGLVAKMLEIGLPTASHLVDKLVEAGMVGRAEDPVDRRRVLVRLSPFGEKIMNALRHGRKERLSRWLSQLEPEDEEALQRGLAALRRIALQDEGDKPS